MLGLFPTKLDNVVLFPEKGPYVYDPEKPPEKEFILDANAEQLETIRADEKLKLRKWILFVVCCVSNLIGLVLILMGLGLTVIFETLKPNIIIFGISFVFFVPFLVWIKFLFFPGRREHRRRKYLQRSRDWRQALDLHRMKVYHGWDEEEREDAKQNGDSNKQQGDSSSNNNNNSTRESHRKVKKVFRLDKNVDFQKKASSLQKHIMLQNNTNSNTRNNNYNANNNGDDEYALPRGMTSRAYVKMLDREKYRENKYITPITEMVNPSVLELPYIPGSTPTRIDLQKGLQAYEVATGLQVKFHV